MVSEEGDGIQGMEGQDCYFESGTLPLGNNLVGGRKENRDAEFLGCSTPVRTVRLKPGEHLLTLCVDNRMKDIQLGVDAHSVSDNTQSNWNGVIGEMLLTARPKAYIESVRIESLMDERKIRTTIRLQSVANVIPVS